MVLLLLSIFLVQFVGWTFREAENLVMRTMKMEVTFREKELNTDGMA